jgi:hypothetical protein
MAMGKRKRRQESLFITDHKLPQSDGHPFYQKRNVPMAEAGFDRWINGRCREFYEQKESARQTVDSAGRLLSHVAGGLFRGDRQERPSFPFSIQPANFAKLFRAELQGGASRSTGDE